MGGSTERLAEGVAAAAAAAAAAVALLMLPLRKAAREKLGGAAAAAAATAVAAAGCATLPATMAAPLKAVTEAVLCKGEAARGVPGVALRALALLEPALPSAAPAGMVFSSPKEGVGAGGGGAAGKGLLALLLLLLLPGVPAAASARN